MAEFLANIWRLVLVAVIATVMVACGGQPEDDLDPESVFAPNMTINDVAANEGGTFVFTVVIEYTQGFEVGVDYTTINGSATAGSDFVAASGRLLIPADATSANITVVSSQDSLDEADEQFTVQLSTPSNATIVDANGIGSILDDDPRPTLSTSSLSINEGQTARVAVVLSQVSGRNVTFNYATANGTAVSSSDYTAVSGVATIPAGSLSTSINVVSVNNLIPEPTETFSVNLSSVVNADSGVLTSTITIVDDDAGQNPQAYVQDVSFTEPNNLVFNVTFSFANTIPMNFDYQTSNGSATQGLDFANTSGRMTVNAGLLAASVTVVGINDNIYEGTETFTLSLSNLVNLNAGDLIATGTITDDESMPNLFVLDSSSTEGGTLSFVVSLTGLSSQNVTFNIATANGTASSGLDFVAQSGARTIPALSGLITLAVATVDDLLDEDDETMNLNISSVVGATAVDNSGVGTILDNDNAPIMSVADVSALEGATLNFTVQIDNPSSKQIVFSFQTYSETAVSGTDFVAVSRQFTITAGSTSVLVPVASIEELIDESDETFAVSLGGLINAQAGDIGAQGTILNDDVPPDLQILNTVAVEGQTAFFVVTMSQPNGVAVVFEYTTQDGTAVAASDYQSSSGFVTVPAMGQVYVLPVLTTDDSTIESDEGFTVSLFNVTGANVIDGSASAVIQDNDAMIFIADGAGTEGSTLLFAVTLSKAVPQASTFQYMTYSGTAAQGVDFVNTTGTVTIPQGVVSVGLSVASIEDAVFEGTESFAISLFGWSTNLSLGDALADGTINDNDTPPEIFVADTSSIEGSTAFFTVSLSAGSVSPVSFSYTTFDQTASSGSDYSSAAGSMTFAALQTALTIAVSGLDDVVEESNETMILSLSSPSGGTLGRAAGIGTIQDNDATVFIVDAAASEGETLAFVVSLSRSLPVNASFQYATQLTGSADVADFTPVANTWVTILAGQTQTTLNVETNEDLMFEPNETFGVTLSNLTNLAAGDVSAVGTINNDDNIPTLDVYDVAVAEGGSAQVKVSLTGLTSEVVYFSYQTFNGSATSGSDFDAATGSQSIAAGNDVRFIFVQTTDDILFEGDENFTFSVSAITNANPGDLVGSVTILDNDPQPRIYVSDVSAAEGATAQVTITLDSAHALATAFNYNTTGITAVDDIDFTDVGGTVSLSPGQMTVVIGVPLLTDATYEMDEMISFDLGGLVGLLAGDLNATVTIIEASAPPNLMVYGDSQLESLQGTVVVSLSALSERPAVFNYQTLNQTAVAPTDYASASGVGTILAGQTQTNIVVSFTPDTTFESDETFLVSLSNVVDANPLNTFAQVTIVNDDPAPEIFINDAVLSESGTTMTFVVTLGNAGTSDTTFFFATSSATATENTDYTGATGWRTILAGNVSTSISVAITEDALDEVDEYFNVALSSISNANIGDIAAVGTILDNDAPPSLAIFDVSGNEGTTLGFVVSLSAVSGREITFNFATVDVGSAISGTDFSSASGSRTISAGLGLITIGVTALADGIFESNETFEVSLSSLVNVTGSDTLAIGTILNTNSAPSLFVSDTSVTEGQSAVVVVSLSTTSAVPVTFNWATVNGTAIAGTDYTAGSGARTILAGALQSSLTIVTINDAIYEGSLTLGVNVSSVVGATVVDGSGAVTILDNETPPISYFTVQGIADPTTVGTPGTVTVTAFNTLGAVKTDYVGTITFSSNNAGATLPSNYTFVGGDAGVRVFNNAVAFNSIGTFYVRAEQVGAATIFGQQSNIDVTNPSAPCNVSTAGFQVSSSSGSETVTAVDLVVALSQPCTAAVTLSFNTLNGTATAGSDYQARSGVLTIPAGSTSRTLNFTVIDDATNEGGGSETFLVSLSNVGPANVSLGTAVHTYTIFDNEGTPPCSASTIGFVNSSGSGLESVANPVFTVSLSQTCAQNVTVNYAFANLSATNGSDFTGINGTATILAGQLTTSIPVTVIDDGTSETPESFRVNLFNAGPNAVAVGLSARDYTITDNDGGPPPCETTIGFAQQNGSALESVTGINLVINSSVACSGYEITVDYSTADLSAVAGSDYTFASGRATFPVNVTSVTVPITVINDASVESEESFKVEISNPQPAGAIILGNAVYTHTILDNDGTGAIYYVRTPANGGNDTNNGLTPGTAFATLGRAITAVAAGDTVFVGAGNYVQSLTIQTAGGVGTPIRWIGDVTGSNTGDPGGVTISDSGSNRVLNINNKGYNTFTNFIIRGASAGEGIYSGTGAPPGIIFKNNTITSNQLGVSLRGAGAMTFENNIVSDNSSAGVFLDTNTRNTIFRNNLVINNGGKGLQLQQNNTGVIIINNTFDSNTGNHIEVGQGGSATITNNIVTNGSAGGIARVSSGSATINFNNVWNNSANYSGGFSAGANDISSNPLYVGGGSYRVQTTSPTLDVGSANASTITFSDGSSMADRSTRSDGVNDGNTFGGDGLKVNMGYHY